MKILWPLSIWKVWIMHVNFKNCYLTPSKDRGAQGDKWYHCWGQHWPQYINLKLYNVIKGCPSSWQVVWPPWQTIQQLSTFVCFTAVFRAQPQPVWPVDTGRVWHTLPKRLTKEICACYGVFRVQKAKRTKSCKNELVTFTELCAIEHNTWLTVTQQGSRA